MATNEETMQMINNARAYKKAVAIKEENLRRARILSEEYFNEYTPNDQIDFVESLEEKEYSSDELITLMAKYSDDNRLRTKER